MGCVLCWYILLYAFLLYHSVGLAQFPRLEIQAGDFQEDLFPLYSNYLLAKPICS